MTKPHALRAILFDMGGTLEHFYYDRDMRLAATADLIQLLAEKGSIVSLTVPELYTRIERGIAHYRDHQAVTSREPPPERFWADYLLVDVGIPTTEIEAMANELSDFFETRFFRRRMRDEAPEVLKTLHERGFIIGMISNTVSRSQVPAHLSRYGIREYFDPVVLSVDYGRRKPDPRIFWHAANLIGVEPHLCCYVGDTTSRDVLGARRAGFGLVVQIPSFLSSQVDTGDEGIEPDAHISDLRELLDIVKEPDLV